MIRYTIRYKGEPIGFATEASATEAIAKFVRLHPRISAKGLTASRPVN